MTAVGSTIHGYGASPEGYFEPLDLGEFSTGIGVPVPFYPKCTYFSGPKVFASLVENQKSSGKVG